MLIYAIHSTALISNMWTNLEAGAGSSLTVHRHCSPRNRDKTEQSGKKTLPRQSGKKTLPSASWKTHSMHQLGEVVWKEECGFAGRKLFSVPGRCGKATDLQGMLSCLQCASLSLTALACLLYTIRRFVSAKTVGCIMAPLYGKKMKTYLCWRSFSRVYMCV